MKLTIEIKLGNDQMACAQQVHHAIMSSTLMQSEMRNVLLEPETSGIIKDINGNRVGRWVIEKE
jgi:hypothetical protein